MSGLNKPILINGFPRSGTTYLFRYLKWLTNNQALFEPITAPQIFIKEYKDYGIPEEAVLYHPKLHANCYFQFIYDPILLEKFLKFIGNFNIKEVTLHFYLGWKLIKNNWNTFLIIRHPVDVFCSFLKSFNLKNRISFKIQNISSKISKKLTYVILRNICRNDLIISAEGIYFIENAKVRNITEAFVLTWTITNYYAVKSVDEDHLIIYEKPKTYLKLPKFVEWLKIEPLKIKKYKAREKYEEEFEKISEELGIGKEYRKLIRLFN